jgi:hypothetical protein
MFFHQIVYSGNHGGDGLLETIAPGKRIGNLVFKIYQNISPSKPNSLRETVSLETWVAAWG